MSEPRARRSFMRRSLLVALREYVDNVRTKTFWIGIIAFPVILTLFMVVPGLLEKTKEARAYGVVDESGWLLEAVEERAASDDARRLLELLREQAHAGDPRLDLLPAELRALANELAGLTDDQLDARARFLSQAGARFGGSASSAGEAAPMAALDDLPDEARRRLAEAQVAFIEWRLNLTPEEARELEAGLSRERYVRVDVPDGVEDAEDWLRSSLEEGSIFAYFVVGADPVEGAEGSRYVSTNLTDSDLKRWFERLATDVVRDRRLDREGIDDATAAWIDRALRFEGRQLGAEGEEAAVETTDIVRQYAPVAFVYLLWVSIFTIANLLLTNTIEEKSNRIIEVLLSSASPLELMLGKILGIAGTGLTVIGSWCLWFIAAVKVLPVVLGGAPPFDLGVIVTDPAYLLSFVSYFILGYLLYAALLVGLGSVFNSLKEAQNLMQPFMIVMLVPLLSMMLVVQDPNGLLARVLSWIPLFTPFIMMNRAAGPPATWEYVGTTLLLAASIVVVTWLAGKVFRIGILMTGKPPKLTEIVRWAVAAEGRSTPPTRD